MGAASSGGSSQGGSSQGGSSQGGALATGGASGAATSGGQGPGGASGAGGVAGGGSGGTSSAAAACPEGPFDSPLPMANPSATPLQGGFKFLEGPVWLSKSGQLLFTDMDFAGSDAEGVPPSVVRALTPPTTITPFLDDIGVNGLALDVDGSVIACTHDTRSVSRLNPQSGARSSVADTFQGMAFNSPNDAIVRSDGTIYFTDPTWQLGTRTQETPFKGVYRITPAGEVTLVADDIASPNGIALSPDESTLYVADDSSGEIRSYSVAGDGSTMGGATFAVVAGVDGMAVDCAGNLYATAVAGVVVLDSAGSEIGTISVAEKPNNCTFGGAERRTLYIMGRTTVFAVELGTPGLP